MGGCDGVDGAMTAARALAAGPGLVELERAGLVRRGRSAADVPERALPVVAELRAVLPGGLRRGATVSVTSSGVASTSLLVLLLAEASQAGAPWPSDHDQEAP